MRLFRKSKPENKKKQQTFVDIPSQQPVHTPRPPSPPAPSLKLTLDLPLLRPSNLDLEGPSLINDSSSRQQQHQQSPPDFSAPANYEIATASSARPDQVSFSQSSVPNPPATAPKKQPAANYDFEYPFLLGDQDSNKKEEEESVQEQLLKQFGKSQSHSSPQAPLATQEPQTQIQQTKQPEEQALLQSKSSSQTAPLSVAALATSILAGSQSPAFYASEGSMLPAGQPTQRPQSSVNAMQPHTAYQQLSTNTSNLAAQHQLAQSFSPKEDSSMSSQENVVKLGSTMANMTLTNSHSPASEAAKKAATRVSNIQRVREASALGKVVAFSGSALKFTSEDEDGDSMPLGDLKRISAAATAAGSADGNNAGMKPLNNAQMLAQAKFNQQPQLQLQHQQLIPPVANQPPMVNMPMGVAAIDPNQMPAGGYPHMKSVVNTPMMAPIQQQQQQQQQSFSLSQHPQLPMPMVMPRNGIIAQQLPLAADIPRIQGGPAASSMYNSTAPSQMPSVASDASKQLFMVPPLAQGSAYTQNPSHMPPGDLRHLQYPQAMQHLVPVVPANRQMPMQKMPLATKPAGQQQQQQQPALMTYIPTQGKLRGTFAKNPLMRDINKAKNFSPSDYTDRPTLLAEADSRRAAKKGMPGIGGSTSHSLQPEMIPVQRQPLQQQQQQLQLQQPASPLVYPRSVQQQQQHYHHGHQYSNPSHSSTRFEMPFQRSVSYQNLVDIGSEHSFSSSSYCTSTPRGLPVSRGRHRGMKKQHQKHRFEQSISAYASEYEDKYPPRVLHKRSALPPPLPPSRGPRVLDRRHRRRKGEEWNDYYDYDDVDGMYAGGHYDDWGDAEYDEYYSDIPAEMGRLERRGAQRRSRGDFDAGRSRAVHPSKLSGRLASRDVGYHNKHPMNLPGYLDDPRDRRGTLAVPHGPLRMEASIESDMSSITKEKKPRSQFGRFLANIKKNASSSTTSSHQLNALDSDMQSLESNTVDARHATVSTCESYQYKTRDSKSAKSHSSASIASSKPPHFRRKAARVITNFSVQPGSAQPSPKTAPQTLDADAASPIAPSPDMPVAAVA
ncbi:hypothetical protein GGI12_000333 [Dipsacomyces acuminosporus]|nr:hypothetical protein GGI12_000333 [Dipsacomyces acuminosporus]